jgi:hypothetical protein
VSGYTVTCKGVAIEKSYDMIIFGEGPDPEPADSEDGLGNT